jgi:two-component system LytT family response regulator
VTLRVAIVEDEPLPRRRLRRMLEAQDAVEVVAACEGRAEAVRWLADHPADVDALFLDVELGDGSGFDVLDALARPLPVVFVTAYDQFAVRAFEVRAADYLLKPFEAEHVGRALERVRERLAHPRSEGELAALRELVAELRAQADAMRASGASGERLARVPVRARGEIVLVPVEEIDWIGSADNYVELHCGQRVHLVRRPMASFEERLDPGRFARIHRRTIVNVERIRACRLDAAGELEVLLHDGRALRVGRSFKGRLAPWLDPSP